MGVPYVTPPAESEVGRSRESDETRKPNHGHVFRTRIRQLYVTRRHRQQTAAFHHCAADQEVGDRSHAPSRNALGCVQYLCLTVKKREGENPGGMVPETAGFRDRDIRPRGCIPCDRDRDEERGHHVDFTAHPGRIWPLKRVQKTRLAPNFQKYGQQTKGDEKSTDNISEVLQPRSQAGKTADYPGHADETSAESAKRKVGGCPNIPEGLQLSRQGIGGIVMVLGQGTAGLTGHRGCLVEVLYLRIGAQFLVHLEMGAFGDKLRNHALLIVEVAELDRLRNTRRRASRGYVQMQARDLVLDLRLIDLLDTETAFLGYAYALVVLDRLFLTSGLPVEPGLIVDDGSRLIRTGYSTVAATYADVVIHCHQAIIALESGPGGANGNTGRLGTMLTAGHQEQPLHIRESTCLHVQHTPPLHFGQGVIAVLARDSAGLAADATVYVDSHAVAFAHAMRLASPSILLIRTRAMSEVLPVASVSSMASDCTEFRLGRPNSLAKGVAQ